MPESAKKAIKVLDPMERLSEILFGLIMVLTITCSFSIGGTGRTEVRNMLIGALGCNLAWGVIDAVTYWMACFSARGRGILALRAVRRADDPAAAHQVIADAPPLLASVMMPPQFEQIRLKLNQLPEPPGEKRLAGRDSRFFNGGDRYTAGPAAFRIYRRPNSGVTHIKRGCHHNAVLNRLCFGRYVGNHPWKMGLAMVLVGAAMVGMTIALGG